MCYLWSISSSSSTALPRLFVIIFTISLLLIFRTWQEKVLLLNYLLLGIRDIYVNHTNVWYIRVLDNNWNTFLTLLNPPLGEALPRVDRADEPQNRWDVQHSELVLAVLRHTHRFPSPLQVLRVESEGNLWPRI